MFASNQKVAVTVLFWFGLASALPAFANDREKAEKRLRQISAMASSDPIARAIINRTMADLVHVKRIELQRQRHAMNLSYGALFIAHQLCASGAKMLDIALELQRGKTMDEIANEYNGDWKKIAEGARKFEDKIEDNIYSHFQHPDADKPVADEKYDVEADAVKPDAAFTSAELASARKEYVFWRNRAAGPRNRSLDSNTASMLDKSSETWDKGDRHP